MHEKSREGFRHSDEHLLVQVEDLLERPQHQIAEVRPLRPMLGLVPVQTENIRAETRRNEQIPKNSRDIDCSSSAWPGSPHRVREGAHRLCLPLCCRYRPYQTFGLDELQCLAARGVHRHLFACAFRRKLLYSCIWSHYARIILLTCNELHVW